LKSESGVLELLKELDQETQQFEQDVEQFRKSAQQAAKQWESAPDTNAALVKLTTAFEPIAEASRDLIKQTDLLYKLANQLVESVKGEVRSLKSEAGSVKENGAGYAKTLSNFKLLTSNFSRSREIAVEQLKKVRYFWKQAHWLTDRVPQGQLRDVEGLVKLVEVKEIEANDWSLTPGRYVGVAPEIEDEDFDLEETLREIHVELEDLNKDAQQLAETIARNFRELGI
jgi:type I restriction enzyme M protein